MSALSRLLLIFATLLWNSAASAKDVPGLPKELAGTTFAANREDCRTYFDSVKAGKIDDQLTTTFGKINGRHTYGDCSVICYGPILNYRAVKNGYVVKMQWVGSFGARRIDHLSVTRIDGNKFRFQFLPNGVINDYIRCRRPGEDTSKAPPPK
jgi:hypothetical protein